MSEQRTKPINRQHTETYRREALALSERIGVAKAARQLGLAESLIYGWRKKYNALSDEQNDDLAKENQRLKRLLAQKEEELAIVKKAATYFAKQLK
ncbi:MAG: transposase [Gammaproteobacteria bacterium]|nr:transposase [Gammaproteobacteria bacterium]